MKIKYHFKDITFFANLPLSPIGYLFYNPISIRLVWVIANFTKITANQITYLSFLAGITTAWCFFQGTSFYLILGALSLTFCNILDWTDGKLARLRNEESAIGAFLDSAFGEFHKPFIVFALSYGQFRITGQEIFLILGIALLFVHLAMSSYGEIKKEIKKSYIKREQKLINKDDSYEFLGKLKDFKNYFEKKKGIYPFYSLGELDALVIIIGPLFGIVKECLMIGLFLSLVMMILHFIIIAIDLSRLH